MQQILLHRFLWLILQYIEKYDFSGKKIIIFATSGSSGLGNTANTLKQSVSKTATIIEGDVLNSNPSVEYLKQCVKKTWREYKKIYK